MKRFTKKATPEEFKFLSFVASAVSKDSHRRALQFILATEAGELVATDGHRCHIWAPETCPLEAGLYEVVKKTKGELILAPTTAFDADSYPDYKRVIPSKDGGVPYPGAYKDSGKLATVLRDMPRGSINIDYFRDMIEMGEHFYKAGDGLSPVLFFNNDCTAVIMPERM